MADNVRNIQDANPPLIVISRKEQEIVDCLRRAGAVRAADELQRVLDRDLEFRRDLAVRAAHLRLDPIAAHS